MVRLMSSVDLLPQEPEHSLLAHGEHHNPHSILGSHPVGVGARVVTFHPEAVAVELLVRPGIAIGMEPLGGWLRRPKGR